METCRHVQAHLYLKLLRDFIFMVQGPQSGNPQKARHIPADRTEASIM